MIQIPGQDMQEIENSDYVGVFLTRDPTIMLYTAVPVSTSVETSPPSLSADSTHTPDDITTGGNRCMITAFNCFR